MTRVGRGKNGARVALPSNWTLVPWWFDKKAFPFENAFSQAARTYLGPSR